jgi:predicted SAM-dependent methyltransferase
VSGLLRGAVDRLTQLIGWLRLHRRISPGLDGNCVKANLGCGLTVAPGWINIDGSLNALIANAPRWVHRAAYRWSGARSFYSEEYYCKTLRENRFVHHNLAYGIPLPNASVDFIYASHFLEHLDNRAGQHLLEEALRVLKPGGVLRVGVPDLEYAWVLYQRGEKERMLHDYFFVADATGFSQHRYLYDFAMLSSRLREAGFSTIHRTQFRQGLTPDLNVLDNREDYTLFVEALKPDMSEHGEE